MRCQSCGAEAGSCQWCVSYAHLTGAEVASFEPADSAAVAQARSGTPVASTYEERQTILRFLRDFSSGSSSAIERPEPVPPPPHVPPARPPVVHREAWVEPLTAQRPPAFGAAWQLATDLAPAGGTVSDRGAAQASGAAEAHAPAEILPIARTRARHRPTAIAAAVLAICGVAAGAAALPVAGGPNGAAGAQANHPVARPGHAAAGEALRTIPARFVMAPKLPKTGGAVGVSRPGGEARGQRS